MNHLRDWLNKRYHASHSPFRMPNRCLACTVSRAQRLHNDANYWYHKAFALQQAQPSPKPTTPLQKGAPMDPRNQTDNSVGQWFWHIHHRTLLEKAQEPISNRVDHILKGKPTDEQQTRLTRLRRAFISPDLEELLESVDAGDGWEESYPTGNSIIDAAVEAAHAQQCTDCPWNGETLLPEKNY